MFEELTEAAAVWDASGLEAVLAAAENSGQWCVLALSYELGYLLEPASAPAGWCPHPSRILARFWHFAACREMDHVAADRWLQGYLANLPADEGISGIGGVQAAIGKDAYAAAVDCIRGYIDAGDCYQVNFTFPLHFSWFGDPLALYARLRQRQPVRYGGVVLLDDGAVLSLSPELFVERHGDLLTVRPMKGTAPRDEPPESLVRSEKNRAENLMIVDLLRNDLGRVAVPGSVRVDSLFEVEAYPSVWQMVSQVSARASDGRLAQVLPALFPCGSITGAPKIRAMQVASELEEAERGLYTGSLGWLAPDGNFRLNVAIRTLELRGNGTGRLGIGSGIVADSDATAEWHECLLKAGFLTGGDPGLLLIETLRREDGVYPRLAGHLARLRGSAGWLGFVWDEEKVRAELDAQPTSGNWRVRLTLAKHGEIVVIAQSLGPEAPGPRWAWLARESIRSDDPLRRHKTTARSRYDAALAEIAGQPAVFDVVFVNERGEVAEGARSTVFVERSGLLLTPPLASGALPGVLRAELLASGRAVETVLRPDDLVGGFFLGNALRGLVPVQLQG